MSIYTIDTLVYQLSDAAGSAEPERQLKIQSALRSAVAQSDWLPPERRTANHQNYARHLLHADPLGRYSLLSIVWSPGQMSPVHSHLTWCAVAVLRGEIEESFFELPAAQSEPTLRKSVKRGAGSISFSESDAGIHRIANRSSELAISLHVYGVGADRVNTGINRVYA